MIRVNFAHVRVCYSIFQQHQTTTNNSFRAPTKCSVPIGPLRIDKLDQTKPMETAGLIDQFLWIQLIHHSTCTSLLSNAAQVDHRHVCSLKSNEIIHKGKTEEIQFVLTIAQYLIYSNAGRRKNSNFTVRFRRKHNETIRSIGHRIAASKRVDNQVLQLVQIVGVLFVALIF